MSARIIKALIPSLLVAAGLTTAIQSSRAHHAGSRPSAIEQSEDQAREKRARAEQALMEGEHLREQGTAEALSQSLEKYEAALQLSRAVKDQGLEARLLLTIGTVHSALGDRQKALNYFRQARPLYQTLGDKQGEATTLNNLAATFYAVDEKQRALDHFGQALRLYRALGDREAEANILNNLGLIQSSAGDHQTAIESHNQALAIFRAEQKQVKEAATLNHLGKAYNAMGEKEQAIEQYSRALALWQTIGDRQMEIETLNHLGAVYSAAGKSDKLFEALEQTLTLYRNRGDRPGEAATLGIIGYLYSSKGRTSRALDHLEQALAIWRADGRRREEAAILTDIGSVYFAAGRKRHALESYGQALKLYEAEGAQRQTLNLLNTIGLVHLSMGDKQQAIDYYNRSLSLWRALGINISYGAATPDNIEFIYGRLSFRKRELDRLARDIRQGPSNDPKEEADRLSRIGAGYAGAGQRTQALNYFNRALPLWRSVGGRLGEARTLAEIAGLYRWLREWEQALDYYNQALPLLRAEGARRDEAQALQSLASLHLLLKDHQQALDYYHQAAGLWRDVGDAERLRRPSTSSAATPPAASASAQSQNPTRSDPASQGPLSASTASNPFTGAYFSQANKLRSISSVYEDLGDRKQALDYLTRSLRVERASINLSKVFTLTRLVKLYAATGEREKALEHIDEAIKDFNQELKQRKIRGTSSEGLRLKNIGEAYAALGEKRQALDYFNRALTVYRDVNERRSEADVLYQMARVERDQGALDEARGHAEAALDIIESLRAGIVNPEYRQFFTATLLNFYEVYIEALMRLHRSRPTEGHDALALQASERSRARTLLETLSEARVDIRQGVDPKLLERERLLKQQLNVKAALQSELLRGPQPDEAEVAAISDQIKALNLEYGKVQNEIRITSPRYAGLTQPQHISLKEIQQQLLDSDTLLLEYALGEERSYLWAVTPTAVASYELPGREEINDAAKRFHQALSNPPPAKAAEGGSSSAAAQQRELIEAASALSKTILGPVAAQLGRKRLVIVADGLLHYVPFAALPDPATIGQERAAPLVVGHEIVSIPSASTLAALRRELAGRRAAPKAVAVLADPVYDANAPRLKARTASATASPDAAANAETTRRIKYAASKLGGKPVGAWQEIPRLPYTRQESEVIAALAPPEERQAVVDFAANLGMATSAELSQYRIVHFATHGILDSENPELSAIVFSLVDERGAPQDGFLRAHDVYNLVLPAELVVLSACRTGLGRAVKGEGLVGMTRGFMYAGAPRVMVSLWGVNDKATSELMARFYRGALKEGLRPAAALQAAQIEMWKQKQWESPYYWAAFALQGEWR